MRMRYLLCTISIFVAITLISTASISLADSPKPPRATIRTDTLRDPLFGIEYHPSEVHFESAPDSINKCKSLHSDRRILFLFGKVVKGNTTFYLVDGWQEVSLNGHDEGTRYFEAQSDQGIIVVVSPDGCHDIGAGYAWSPEERERRMAEKYGITEDVVSSLIDDAIKTEVQAFGGKKELLQRIDGAIRDGLVLPPLIQRRLGVLRK
jgi:hypothetical protein